MTNGRERAGDGSVTVLTVERPRPAAVREHRWAPWFAVGTVCFGAFMGQLDASIVTLAFPAMQHDFGVRLAGTQWVSLAYLLVLVALLVPVGRWSDQAGRKLIYLYGFVVFTVASAGCGLATSLAVLVGLRVVQAAGAAMLQANSVALVATSVPANRRRAALGVQAGAQAIGLALGPTLGGLVVGAMGWRWIFWINIPVGIVAVVAGWFLLPRTRHHAASGKFDAAGLALLAVSSTAFLLVLSSGAGLALDGWHVAALAVLALAGGAGLVWWERRAPRPLLDPGVFATPGVAAGLVGALTGYLVLFGPLVLFPQVATGGVVAAGLMLTALPAGFGLAAIGAERVIPARWSDRLRAVLASATAVGAAAILAVPMPVWARVIALAGLGLGLGVFIPANNAAIMSRVPDQMAATVGGMLNMARGLGTAIGVAVVSLALHLSGRVGSGTDGVALAMITLAGFALVALVSSRYTPADGHRAAEVTELA